MYNFAVRSAELVDVRDMMETDIFQMLMRRDNVERNDFLKLCDDAKRQLRQAGNLQVKSAQPQSNFCAA